MAVVGVDIGTQSTKGVLLDDAGAVAAVATAPHGIEFPAPGWAQQDSNDWLNAAEQVLAELALQAPIEVIGLSAQVDGVVALDTSYQPMHPALIWMDRRATDVVTAVEKSLSPEEIYRITGLNSDATHCAPKMRWLLDKLEAPARHLVPPATVVTSWLTGNLAQDHANASSTMVYDITARTWSAQMLDLFDIDPALLPPVVESIDEVGPVRESLRSRLGLAPGCRVLAGTGDDHAAAVGAGAVRSGVVVDITGTAEPIGTSAEAAVLDPEHLVEVHAHAVPGALFVENPGFVSGGSVLWVAGLLGIDQAEVFARAESAERGARGLHFIPALSGSMAPRWNERARGSFTGITMEHTAADWSRAVIEGCTFAARDVIDRLAGLGLPIQDLRVTGGGARSAWWLQTKADALGRPLRPVTGDGSAFGAACLAAVGAGWFADLPAATDALVELGDRIFEPNPAAHERYDELYRNYRMIFDTLEPLWDQR